MGILIGETEFIERAQEIYGDFYDYSKVDYINSYTKVIIICPIHGEFEQLPSNHLVGKGCIKCGYLNNSKKHSLNQKQFIEKSLEIHGDFYDYSKVNYI